MATIWYNIRDSRYGTHDDFVFATGLSQADSQYIAECFKDELLFILGADLDVEVWVE